MSLVLVLLGGALGATTRWLVAHSLRRRAHPAAATVVVNAVGAFLLGWISVAGVATDARLLLGTGFCGALTTFSALSFDLVSLTEARRWRGALAVLLLHLTVCLGACWVGAALS